jgi:type I restriction enzyme S subunit
MSWPTAALGDLCQINIGRTPSRSVPAFWEGGDHPWLAISDMGRSKEIRTTKEGITEAAIDACNMRLVNPGTVLFSFKLSIGKVGIASVPLFTNEAIASLPILDSGILCKGFLIHALEKVSQKLVGDRAAMGMTLNKASLAEIQIPLPQLEEQRRIAAILDKCNAIQAADRKRRETLGRFQTSYFRYLFGEPSIAPGNWPLKTIASCSAAIQTGPFGSLLHQSDYIQGGIPILNPKHIANGVIACRENETIGREKAGELTGYQLQEGDVLLARRGEMGRCAVITSEEDGWLCGTGAMFIRPLAGTLAPEYLCALLSSQCMRSKLQNIAIGTTLLNLNAKIVGDLSIPVPPIGLQRRYVDVLARLSAMGDMTTRSAHARSAAIASIQNKLLTAAGS